MAKLILVKTEDSPEDQDAAALFAYFDGTPEPAQLVAAFRQKYLKADPEEASYDPTQYQDAVADRAGLERWYLCQRI